MELYSYQLVAYGRSVEAPRTMLSTIEYKRQQRVDPLEPGNVIVVVISYITGSWELGRIIEVPLSEGVSVRQAMIKIGSESILELPSSKLAVLASEYHSTLIIFIHQVIFS